MSSIALMKAVDSSDSPRPSPRPGTDAPAGRYAVTEEELAEMNAAKDPKVLFGHGNVDGLAKILCSDCMVGLASNSGVDDERSVLSHRQAFGPNTYPVCPPKAFWAIVWETLQDPIIIILCFAALASTVLGAAIKSQREERAWVDGVAIWIAVAIVTCVGAANDYQKDKQFRKLNGDRDVFEVKVVRDNKQCMVINTQVVVGDIMMLDTGDKIIADGVCIEVFGLVVDEASLTGESEPIQKNTSDDPWVRSGTQVTEGSGKMLVVAVGKNSEWGKTLLLLEEAEDENTPLQDKLADVASLIGKVGVGVAVACFVALLIKWCIQNRGFPLSKINDNGPISFFLFAITIIVVAVPEGLPLAVTISLAYSMKKMMKDQNFVRVLAACETMGGATAICSDKTGTLTQNRMTVTQGWFSGKSLTTCPTTADMRPEILEELKINISLNSKAFINPGEKGALPEFVGSRTECALLTMLGGWGMDYEATRKMYVYEKMYGFTSDKKMSSCLIRFDDKFRLYNKGAAEWVLQRCKHAYNEYGDVVPLDTAATQALQASVTEMAKCGLRCIALAHTDYPVTDASRADDFFDNCDNVDQNLIVSAIVGIKDPLRPEVPEAVRQCQRAGIIVRMVTGDNKHTAEHIARECGILFDDGIAMEGPEFRTMATADMLALLPRLRVLARSSPKDKLTLVQLLKGQGEVVAVTGDGTNDAPALKESDVGLAMGIAGTEVAKEAADIIILDDNFSSIVKSVLWGRSVFNNIRKFLQFQLTVNCVALVISFVGAVVGGDEPLNVLQLLWVNLIMDTMGALALATEPPHPDLLLQPPNGRTEQLITKTMWKHIVIQSLYQLLWLFLFIFGLPKIGFVRYTPIDSTTFYNANCDSQIMSHNNLNITEAAYVCNGLIKCGFPLGAQQMADDCWLYRDVWSHAGLAVPSDMRLAFCGPASTASCPAYVTAKSARDWMLVKVTKQHAVVKENMLSVLFNAFIWMQLTNEICARRISDEYTIFENFFANPIFIAVVLITAACQVLIMEVIGSFFKVTRLTGYEWLITVAIGFGSFPVSYLTRFVSRMLESRARVSPSSWSMNACKSVANVAHTTVRVRPSNQ